jgi:hypothetical protein
MPCTHCPHCTADGDLRLPAPPDRTPGLDVGYYRRFLAAHTAAAAVSAQPLRLLRQVNPWLTREQARAHLHRARQLPPESAPPERVQAILGHPWVQAVAGIPVDRTMVAAAMPGHDPDQVLAVLREAGWRPDPSGALVAG